MPNPGYHEEKRDRFQDTAIQLENAGNIHSNDANVQDYFYAAMHEAERYLGILGRHSRTHNHRNNIITNFMVYAGRLMRRDRFRRNPGYPSDRVFDNNSEAAFMALAALRLNLVYGNTDLGPLQHADQRDVQRARALFMRFMNSIIRHEHNLRARGII
jgi:hypothetical protein